MGQSDIRRNGQLRPLGWLPRSEMTALAPFVVPQFRRVEAQSDSQLTRGDVRYWPKADMSQCTAHVCFWGQSRHLGMSPFAVAIGGEAAYVR